MIGEKKVLPCVSIVAKQTVFSKTNSFLGFIFGLLLSNIIIFDFFFRQNATHHLFLFLHCSKYIQRSQVYIMFRKGGHTDIDVQETTVTLTEKFREIATVFFRKQMALVLRFFSRVNEAPFDRTNGVNTLLVFVAYYISGTHTRFTCVCCACARARAHACCTATARPYVK